MSRFRRLGSAIFDYELAFGINVLEDLKKPHRWKLFATLGVAAPVPTVVVAPHVVDTGVGIGPGVAAAVSALGAAAMVFVSMIQPALGERRFADHLVRIVSGILALLAGWHWLLAETEGHLWPLLLWIAPIAGVLVGAVALVTLRDVLKKADDRLIAEGQDEYLVQQLRQIYPENSEQMIKVLKLYLEVRRQVR